MTVCIFINTCHFQNCLLAGCWAGFAAEMFSIELGPTSQGGFALYVFFSPWVSEWDAEQRWQIEKRELAFFFFSQTGFQEWWNREGSLELKFPFLFSVRFRFGKSEKRWTTRMLFMQGDTSGLMIQFVDLDFYIQLSAISCSGLRCLMLKWHTLPLYKSDRKL